MLEYDETNIQESSINQKSNPSVINCTGIANVEDF